MTGFSLAVQGLTVGVLVLLLIYTLALVRFGRLSARLTVSWVLAELGAIAVVLLWGRLPVIVFTSSLGDRELLVVLAVLFFAFVVYLMLDSLQRISAQSLQIARLTQEIALLRVDAGRESRDVTRAAARSADADTTPDEPAREPAGLLTQWLLAAWVIGCIAFLVLQGYDRLPSTIVKLLTAQYQQ